MTDEDIQYPGVPFDLRRSLALLFRRGSESHGLFRPSTDPDSIDDRDLMGVCILPMDYYLGTKQWTHAESIKGVWDVVLYELRKFVGLLVKQNPNVISALWLQPDDYLFVSPAGRLFLDNRNLFRCRGDAFNSFLGYANSQLHKMVGGAFKGYMGDKRKKLVERFGYDTKNAAQPDPAVAHGQGIPSHRRDAGQANMGPRYAARHKIWRLGARPCAAIRRRVLQGVQGCRGNVATARSGRHGSGQCASVRGIWQPRPTHPMNREAMIAELVDIQLALELLPGDGWDEFLAKLPDNRDRAMAEMIRNDRERHAGERRAG